MNLHLSDEQAAALPGELDRIIESDPTRSAPDPHASRIRVMIEPYPERS
jgi:hypothetical protein